jgi:hypothetical protein
MNACGCMYRECATPGFCIAQNPGRPIPMAPLPVYWRDAPSAAPDGPPEALQPNEQNAPEGAAGGQQT